MPPAKKTTRRRPKSFGQKFKENPLTTTVNEAKKLGVPKWASKFALLGVALGALAPNTVAPQANRIPFMNIFTSAGSNLRARLLGMRRQG
jgi:hypothetical protein